MQVGDNISVKVYAEDPNSLPLEYKFFIMQRCGVTGTLQEFGPSSELESYILTDSDVNECNQIGVAIRNSDGIQYVHDNFGDVLLQIPIDVSNGTIRPSLNSLDIYINGVLQSPGFPSISTRVGDVISIGANATDPKSLPLEYKFGLYNANGFTLLSDFSAVNLLTSYTITAADIKKGSNIVVGVKNDDGTIYSSIMYGDLQYSVSLNVMDSTLPPQLSSVDIYVNGILYPRGMHVYAHLGDSISVQAYAVDPKSLPLEYKFASMHNCMGMGTLQEFSSSNTLSSYTVTNADINSCNGINIGIRNNDGIDYDSPQLGDLQHFVNIIVVP